MPRVVPASDVVSLLVDRVRPLATAPQAEWPGVASLSDETANLVGELCSSADGVRDLALLLCGYVVVAGERLDFTDPLVGHVGANHRLPSDRTASDRLRDALRDLGIAATSPLQNSTFRGGYISPQVARPVSNQFVRWLSDASRTVVEVDVVLDHLARAIALTANRVPPLPDTDLRRFTFSRTIALFDALLTIRSDGAVQQYLVQALYDALLQEGREPLRAYTKQVVATDRSAGTAGDVEVRRGQNLVQAFEISASQWQDKMRQAVDSLRERPEIDRTTVLAAGAPEGHQIETAVAASLRPGEQTEMFDVAVLELRHEVRSVVARASNRARQAALIGLYRNLRGWHAPVAVVEEVVSRVADAGLS